MSHVVSRELEPVRAMHGALEVHVLPAAIDNLAFVAVCTATGAAAVVDAPGLEPVWSLARARGVTPTAIFNTHVHGDHVGINRELAGRGELARWRVVGAARTAAAIPGLTEPVHEGSQVRLGAVVGRVLETPGHLDGHVCFVFGDALFCGDTLFAGGCGYLFDGPPAAMYASLSRLAELPPDTRVFCAHEYTQDNLRFAWSVEPENDALARRIREVWRIRSDGGCTVPSTIGLERATNPFLRGGSTALRRNLAQQLPQADLRDPVEVFAATRALKDRKAYRAIGDDQLPLAEAPA
jgi:hydroxyacylglutathione hydrolase